MHGLSNGVAAGFSCAQYEQWKAENTDGDDKFAALFEEGLVKPCPKCKKPIMKNEGEPTFLYYCVSGVFVISCVIQCYCALHCIRLALSD